MVMKYLVFIGLIWLSAISAAGQVQDVDSLLNALNTGKHSFHEQAELYDQIVVSYGSSGNFGKAIEYAEEGLLIARKINDKSLMASFNESIGISYYSIGDYETAVTYLERALDLAVKANDPKAELTVHMSIGAYYGRLGQYEEALKHFIDALAIGENSSDKRLYVEALGNIGIIYLILDPGKAVPYFEKMIDAADESDMPRTKIRAFHELGRYYTNTHDFPKALEYAQKAVDLSRIYNSAIYEALGLGQLAQIYNGMGDYDKALGVLAESIPVAEKTNDPTVLANTWKSMSDVYLRQERYQESEQAASRSWQLDSTGLAIKSELLFNLAYSNAFLSDAKKTSAYLAAYREAMREMSDKNFHEALVDTEAKYETEKKELRIASLEKERRLYLWLGVAGGLLAIALTLVLWQIAKNARKERQLVAANAIQDGEMGERTRIASELHDRLGGSLSSVKIELGNKENMQDIGKKLDDCIEEMRRITHNLMPRSLQFGIKAALEDISAQFANIHFHFFGEEKRMEKRLEFVVYCCANELVTNALRHSGASTINIQLIQSEKRVSLTVQDDGCGFHEKSIQEGIGLKNIRDRVASCEGKLDIITSPGNGTEITIELNASKNR